MFKSKTIKEQLFEERRKNEALLSQFIKLNANVQYVAMMTDINILDEEITEMEKEGVDTDEQI